MATPPCHRSKNRAFTTLNTTPQSIRAATTICEACPVRAKCAETALTAGTTIDGVPHPANDVVQAGVECRGDLRTAWAVAEVAGVPVPDYWAEKPTRRKIDDHCKHCKHPMVSWTRGAVPEGYNLHHARGYCTACRSQYKQALATERADTGHRPQLRKVTDRKRHTAPRRTKKPVTVQLSLFSREEAKSA